MDERAQTLANAKLHKW